MKRKKTSSATSSADAPSVGLDRRRFLEGLAVSAAAGTALTGMSARRAAAADAPSLSSYGESQPPQLKELKGKVAYITGASSGIGLALARECRNAGMKVALGYIDESQLQEALSFFKPDDPDLLTIRHDVTDREGWVRTADAIEKKFGNVHLLANNAGVSPATLATIATHKDWEWCLNVNLWGCIYGINTFVPRMLKHGQGSHIVSTCSMSGVLPGNSAGVYIVSKFAVAGLIEQSRVELQDTNIGTSLFVPGQTATNFSQSEKYRPATLKNDPAVKPAAAPPPRPAGPPGPARMEPTEAAKWVMDGVAHNDLFIFSHPEWRPGVKMRVDAMMASISETMPKDRVPADPLRTNIYAREIEHRRKTPNRTIKS